MRNLDAELITLRRVCPDADLKTEGGRPVVVLPSLQIELPGKKRVTRDAVLWPHERDGYPSRLFLSEPVTAPNAQNWKPHNLLARCWHACSWTGVPNTLPLIEILANHLRAFR